MMIIQYYRRHQNKSAIKIQQRDLTFQVSIKCSANLIRRIREAQIVSKCEGQDKNKYKIKQSPKTYTINGECGDCDWFYCVPIFVSYSYQAISRLLEQNGAHE